MLEILPRILTLFFAKSWSILIKYQYDERNKNLGDYPIIEFWTQAFFLHRQA
jgi:hypothetical protein